MMRFIWIEKTTFDCDRDYVVSHARRTYDDGFVNIRVIRAIDI